MDEGRKISFYSDAAHNYMVLECPPASKDNYQYKMLAANRIKGLLSCSGRTIDRREYLYYDISSRQSLKDLYNRRSVRSADLHRILEDLIHVEETLTEYLLDTSHLILEPSCVYMDFREQVCSFVYYPGEEQEKGPEPLFSFLADRVDGRDKQAAALIYRLCMLAEKPGFRLRTQLLADLGIQIDRETDRHDIYGYEPRPLFTRDDDIKKSGDGWSVTDMHRGKNDRTGTYSCRDAGTASDRGWREDIRAGTAGSGVRYYGYEDSDAEEADTGVEKESEGGNGRGGIRGFLLTGFMTAAGIGLFLSGRFLDLGERESILTLASGLVLAVGGVFLLILQILRGRRKKSDQEAETAAVPVFTAPEPWETLPYHSSPPEDIGAFYGERGRAGTKIQNVPGFSGNPYAIPGETSLLGPDTRPAAGLYGTGNCRGEQISLAELPCVVGKMREYVDQVLDDSSVSRMHARFSLDRDGKMTVRDLNSTNGTWLNGERLLPNECHALQQGDHLRIGRLEFVFR